MNLISSTGMSELLVSSHFPLTKNIRLLWRVINMRTGSCILDKMTTQPITLMLLSQTTDLEYRLQ